jgi:hypothetical protein
MLTKISWVSLTKLLAKQKFPYITEIDENFKDRTVFRLVAAKELPESWILTPDYLDQQKINQSRKNPNGATILLYDIDSQEILGASYSLYQFFKQQRTSIVAQ